MHGNLFLFFPEVEMIAESGILVAIRFYLKIFFPEDLKGYPRTLYTINKLVSRIWNINWLIYKFWIIAVNMKNEFIELTSEEKEELRSYHKTLKDKTKAYRINAILL